MRSQSLCMLSEAIINLDDADSRLCDVEQLSSKSAHDGSSIPFTAKIYSSREYRIVVLLEIM